MRKKEFSTVFLHCVLNARYLTYMVFPLSVAWASAECLVFAEQHRRASRIGQHHEGRQARSWGWPSQTSHSPTVPEQGPAGDNSFKWWFLTSQSNGSGSKSNQGHQSRTMETGPEAKLLPRSEVHPGDGAGSAVGEKATSYVGPTPIHKNSSVTKGWT